MTINDNTDNIYKEGTVICAKENPGLQLIITKYFQRIYYCAVIGEPKHKILAYFERELLAPLYSYLRIDKPKMNCVFRAL